MKDILVVKADDKNIKVSINGENIDLLKGIMEALKAIEKQGGPTMDHSMSIIKGWINEEKDKRYEEARNKK